jgi:prephenate dehydrogenase
MEMTRIAKSDPALWEAIFRDNRSALKPALADFERAYGAIKRALYRNEHGTLRRILAVCKSARDGLEKA